MYKIFLDPYNELRLSKVCTISYSTRNNTVVSLNWKTERISRKCSLSTCFTHQNLETFAAKSLTFKRVTHLRIWVRTHTYSERQCIHQPTARLMKNTSRWDSRQEFWDNKVCSNYSVKFQQLPPDSIMQEEESTVKTQELSNHPPRLLSQFEGTKADIPW